MVWRTAHRAACPTQHNRRLHQVCGPRRWGLSYPQRRTSCARLNLKGALFVAKAAHIASALITTKLPNEDVAGLMLEMADVSAPVSMQTPPAAASVERVLKKGWAKVATAVISGTREFLGTRLTKHSSVQIRRLLAENSADLEVVAALHDWAFEKDSECFGIVVNRADPAWLFDRYRTGAYPYQRAVLTQIGHRLANERPDLVEDILLLDVDARDAMLIAAAPMIAAARVPGWTVHRLWTVLQPGSVDEATRRILHWCPGPITTDVVQELTAHPTSAKVLSTDVFHTAKEYELRAARMLIEHADAHAMRIIDTDWDMQLFDAFVARASIDVVATLLESEQAVRRLSCQQVSAAIRLITSASAQPIERGRPTLLNQHLLQVLEFELETDVLLTYLRNAPEYATWKWLAGTVQAPRPGEIEALFANPGFAFGWSYQYASRGTSITSATAEEIANDVASRIAEFVRLPWCDRIVDAAGPMVIDQLLSGYNYVGSQYIADRIVRELGDTPDLWRAAIAQLERTQLSFGKTLHAVRKLRSITRTDIESDAPPPRSFAEQIALRAELRQAESDLRVANQRIDDLRKALYLC